MNTKPSSRRSRLSRLSLLAAGIMLASTLHAQEATYILKLPAQPLDQALNALAGQTGSRILFATEIAADQQAPALSGELTLQQALQRLLQGTGLTVQEAGDGSYVIAEPASVGATLNLGAITIQGQGMGYTTEHTGSYASPVVTIGKGAKSIKDIPQSVSVVTQQRLADQNLTTMKDVLDNAPGVTVVPMFGTGDQYYSRGFFIENFQYDGVPLERQSYARGSNLTAQTAIFDRVEILRGAQGLLEGGGNPSGSVNFVRKRPTAVNQVKLTAQAGSWDHYGTQADISGPLDEQGRLRGRLVMDYDTRNSFTDHVGDDRQTLYAALDFDLTDATRIGIGYSRERVDANIDANGLPNYNDGSIPHYSRSAFLGGKWAYWDKIQDTYYFDIAHQFNDDWSLTTTVVNVREKSDYQYLLRSGVNNPDNTGPLRGDAYVFDFFSEHWGGDIYLNGRTQLAGHQLNLTMGANYTDLDSSDTFGWKRNHVPNWDIFGNPVDGNKPSKESILAANRLDDGFASIQKGAYGMGQYYLTDSLSIILGARVSSYQKAYRSDGAWGASKSVAKESAQVTPYAGIIYDLDPTWSTYASYTKIFLPQSMRSATGSIIDPKTGNSVEVGLKGVFDEGRLNATFAMFRMEQDNIPIWDADLDQDIQDANCGGTCYYAGGTAISRGFEAELNGELVDNLQVYASYTLNLLRFQKDAPSVSDDVGASVEVPKHMLRTWLNYRLPGEWERVSVGGGVNAQSGSAGYGYNGREQAGFAIWNARLGYRFTDELSGAMNINNLFDKRYYKSVDYGNNYFGDPRNVLFTLTYSY
ncbi:MAG: TonB-dependent siderophore receptor [Pseudomonas sp.]|uniref:TonB-dependent siderophore receptor n=1 Tax=Pseudomonas sp. TaxID=306 RepID=UPI003D0C62BB